MTGTTSLAPLRERNFRWYFASRTVDLAGSTMSVVASAFAVLQVRNSPGALGVVLAAHSIPMVAFLLVGGVIADRFGRTLVIQVSNVLAGLTQLAFAALVISGDAHLWMLVVLTAVNGTVSAMTFPALASVLPQLVPREQLQTANALNSVARNALAVSGPAVAGLVVVTVGAGWAVAVDGVSFLIAAVLLLPVDLPAPRRDAAATSTLHDLREGWRFFAATTWLWVIVLAFGVENMLHAAGYLTLGPVLAKGSAIGEGGWGLVLSAEAVGWLVTSLVMLRVRLGRPLLWGMLGAAAYGFPMLALGLGQPLVVVMLAAFVGGAGIEVFGLGWNLAMQEHVPEEMLSRAFSYDALGSYVAIPVGQLAAGPLAGAFGVRPVVLVCGGVLVVTSLLVLVSRSVRDLPRAAPVLDHPVSTTSASPS